MPDRNEKIQIDRNNPTFQDTLFALQKNEQLAVLRGLQKIKRLTWQQLYADKGLHWEKISGIIPPPNIAAVYSLRITQSCRALAYRHDDFLCMLAIFADHDSAYGKL